MLLYTEIDNINENLRLEIGEAVDKWVNSLVDYHLQNINTPDNPIIDRAATIKEHLRNHSAALAADMTYGIEEKWKLIENEMVQLLEAIAKAEQIPIPKVD